MEGNIIYSYTIPTNAFDSKKAVLERIINVIDRVLEESDKSIVEVKAIGIGSPGPLDAKNGIISIANTIVSFDPEVVVIDGGVSKGGSILFDKVREVVNKRGLKSMVEACKIVPAGLGSDAGVMGAVAFAITESK